MIGPVQQGIMRSLCKFPHGLSTPEMIEQVYAGAKEPEFAQECIYVAIHKLRKILKGVEIRHIRNGKFRYQLWFT